MKRSTFYYLIHPSDGFSAFLCKISDRYAIEQQWKQRMDYPLNLKDPKTFNEKLQWLKLYDRNPLYTTLVDKYRVKQWVANKIGEQYVIPTLAVYKSADEINIDKLPDKFVLKCNHDSGSVVICKDKTTFDLASAKTKLNKSIKQNFYYNAREWPYKKVKRCIIAEKLIENNGIGDIPDYKVFTFGGEPKIIQVDIDRFNNHKRNIYDTNWNFINAQIQYPSQPNLIIDKPKQLMEMLDICRKLGEGFCQVRVDFYVTDNNIYFGEMTFFHGGGLETFMPKSFELQMGEWIKLSTV